MDGGRGLARSRKDMIKTLSVRQLAGRKGISLPSGGPPFIDRLSLNTGTAPIQIIGFVSPLPPRDSYIG